MMDQGNIASLHSPHMDNPCDKKNSGITSIYSSSSHSPLNECFRFCCAACVHVFPFLENKRNEKSAQQCWRKFFAYVGLVTSALLFVSSVDLNHLPIISFQEDVGLYGQKESVSCHNQSHHKTLQNHGRSLWEEKKYSSIFGRINFWKRNNTKSQAASEHSVSQSRLVIAGKMIVDGLPCNIAEMDLSSGECNLSEFIQLNLYKSYTGGEVFHLLANHTFHLGSEEREGLSDDESGSEDGKREGQEVIVVGAFDTTYKNSQVTYCSVGKWDGSKLSKVGEGLCNSALSKGMKITTAALAGPQDVYVAGSFNTQVWNGDKHDFVQIFNVAHYNTIEQVWLPLPFGQVSCSWCIVTILALAWDPKKSQLHVAGKFNAIDGKNIPAGLAIYDYRSRRLVAHPGGGLSMVNVTEDGVGTSLQLDEESGVLYVMGAFERLTATGEICFGLAAYSIAQQHWTCLSDSRYTVLPSGGGNMLLSKYGLMVSGLTTNSTTWTDPSRPYTIAVMKTTLMSNYAKHKANGDPEWDLDEIDDQNNPHVKWTWLPGFPGSSEPLHVLANGFADHEGTVFIGGENFIAKWRYVEKSPSRGNAGESSHQLRTSDSYKAITTSLGEGNIKGSIMTISQRIIPSEYIPPSRTPYNLIFIGLSLSGFIGILIAIVCNKNMNSKVIALLSRDSGQGISLDTLTYSNTQNTSLAEAYQRAMDAAMHARSVHDLRLIALIDPQEIVLHRIIGEGTFGRVWSATWRSSKVAVKEFVFAQAAVTGRSSMQREIIEEIIGEAGMMAILRHPHVLQLFGCSLTAQAIWIVSELCTLGSLRQVLDDHSRKLSIALRLQLAVHVAEGMTYLHTQDPPIIHRDLKSHNIFVQETFHDANASKWKREKKKNREMLSISSKHKKLGNSSARHDAKYYGAVDTAGSANINELPILAKIGDWGSARAALSGSRTMTHGVGTACWLAPEVIKNARSSKKSDVYSFGIVLWELATRDEVYKRLETTQIIARVANDNLRPPVPENCPWKDLMVKCWEENESNRPTFETITNELTKLLRWYQNREEKSGNSLESYQ